MICENGCSLARIGEIEIAQAVDMSRPAHHKLPQIRMAGHGA